MREDQCLNLQVIDDKSNILNFIYLIPNDAQAVQPPNINSLFKKNNKVAAGDDVSHADAGTAPNVTEGA